MGACHDGMLYAACCEACQTGHAPGRVHTAAGVGPLSLRTLTAAWRSCRTAVILRLILRPPPTGCRAPAVPGPGREFGSTKPRNREPALCFTCHAGLQL